MESLIHYYKERNLLYVINGEGDFDNVFDNINEGLFVCKQITTQIELKLCDLKQLTNVSYEGD